MPFTKGAENFTDGSFNEELDEDIRILANEGYSIEEIAIELGCSRLDVENVLEKFNST